MEFRNKFGNKEFYYNQFTSSITNYIHFYSLLFVTLIYRVGNINVQISFIWLTNPFRASNITDKTKHCGLKAQYHKPSFFSILPTFFLDNRFRVKTFFIMFHQKMREVQTMKRVSQQFYVMSGLAILDTIQEVNYN